MRTKFALLILNLLRYVLMNYLYLRTSSHNSYDMVYLILLPYSGVSGLKP